MKFVIFSYNFIPKADAESYCTTRFASALARTGHDVHVVTMDWPQEVGTEASRFLVDDKIKLTRVPLSNPKGLRGLLRLRYFTHELGAVDVPTCIRAVKKVLRENQDAILVTRAVPFVSLIVGWYCRRLSKAWIAHFSDPLSHLPRGTFMSELRYRSMRFWLNRVMKRANGISLTCNAVKRYYLDEHGELFEKARTFVANHLGEPELPTNAIYVEDHKLPTLAHAGYLNELRGSREVLDAVEAINKEGESCQFLQCGREDEFTHGILEASKFARIVPNSQPDMATAVCNSATAVFIADQDTEFGYIPFIPSKFAYQIFTDKPLVILTRPGSAMYEYSKKYPQAGLYVAAFGDSDGLKCAVRSALENAKTVFDRTGLRYEFSQKGVAEKFVQDVEAVL